MSYICIIVESPSKCQKIESYLGQGYKCIASYGHLRQLKQLEHIGIDRGFVPTYTHTEETIKLKQIEKLRTMISRAKEVILATDDDREGESIAWHICVMFDLQMDTKRIVFHEISKQAIQYAILHPRQIDMRLVNSQQARQILDLLVGYTITPILWDCIAKNHKDSLSAGRCQTPALRIIYDNYIEQKDNKNKQIYKITGYFTNKIIPFDLSQTFEFPEQVTNFLQNTINFKHIYNISSPKESKISSPEHLTTSKLQQLASNELHLSPKETMIYAQELYENGLITYMRTDSNKYSKEFIDSAKDYILRTYNDSKYISSNIDPLCETPENNNLVKEAHEAIRPVDIRVKHSEIMDKIHTKSKKIYEMIWKRTLESCMSDTISYYINAEITAFGDIRFKHRSDQIVFPGWKIVEKKYEETNSVYSYLSNLKQNSIMEYKKIVSNVKIEHNSSHYTEARLVQLLEDKGIGRPSTFSMLVDKIQERSYVSKENISGIKVSCKEHTLESDMLSETMIEREFGNEKNKLLIQPLGILVIEFLIQHFEKLFNYEYTKKMENELDLISQGKKEYAVLCEVVYKELNELIEPIKKQKCKIKIDDNHEFIVGKNGPIIKKTINQNVQFLPVKKDIDITKLKMNEYELLDLVDTDSLKESIGTYQGVDLFIKKGKYGIYAEWGRNKRSLSELGNKPIKTITYIEVLKILEKNDLLDPSKPIGIVREISDNVSIRTGKFGDYIFYKNTKMKKAQFFPLKEFKGDYKSCSLTIIKNWIKEKHNVV